jgi:hypothetical protein
MGNLVFCVCFSSKNDIKKIKARVDITTSVKYPCFYSDSYNFEAKKNEKFNTLSTMKVKRGDGRVLNLQRISFIFG